jgi:hypothetical protein
MVYDTTNQQIWLETTNNTARKLLFD